MALAGYAAAVLNNGLGRYEAAFDGAKRASDDGDFGYSGAALPELVEAALVLARRRSPAAALRPAGGADTGRGHGLGARNPGTLTSADQRGRGRGRLLP